MKVTIKADTDDSEAYSDIILSNNNLDNFNFVEIIIDDKVYMVLVDDLLRAAKAFKYGKKD